MDDAAQHYSRAAAHPAFCRPNSSAPRGGVANLLAVTNPQALSPGTTASSNHQLPRQLMKKKQNENMEDVVVVVGGGIVGISTCYYLLKQGRKKRLILVEREKIACAASGKAGGLIGGVGWGDEITEPLHEKGFQLHKELATDLELKSYREISTYQVMFRKNNRFKGEEEGGARLLDRKETKINAIQAQTAQVTPLELCEKMFAYCVEKGVEVVYGEAQLEKRNGEFVVNVNGEIFAGMCVLATGPWAIEAEDWLGVSMPMVGIASSSMILRNLDAKVDAKVCFCQQDAKTETHLEIYPRPDNSIYVCGMGGSPHLDKEDIVKTRAETVPRSSKAPRVLGLLERVTAVGVDSSTEFVLQSCMRPCADDALPIIDKIGNVVVATGLNCWGITWGPAVGCLVSEMIGEKKTSINISPFSLGRFS